MAVRFDAANERLTVAHGGTLVGADFTMCGWAVIDVDRNAATPFFGLGDVSGNYWLVITAADGTTLQIWSAFVSPVLNSGHSMTVGKWYFLAVTFDITGNAIVLYWADDDDATISSVSGSGGTIGSEFCLGSRNGSTNFLNGRLAHSKVWTATLTAAEIERERWSTIPQRTADLWAYYPLDGINTQDYSGNGRTLTSNGTLADQNGPPIGYGAPIIDTQIVTGGAGGDVTGTAAADLGEFTGTAVGQRDVLGVASADLGTLTATAAGQRDVLAVAAAGLGALTAVAAGQRDTFGMAAASLGALTATVVLAPPLVAVVTITSAVTSPPVASTVTTVEARSAVTQPITLSSTVTP